MMTTTELHRVLAGLNGDLFNELFDGLVRDPNYAHASMSSNEAALKSRRACGSGRLRGQPASCRDLSRHIMLTQTGRNLPSGQVAVGWVLDHDTETEKQELPVVVAVGINYGQGATYLNPPVPWAEPTQMRPRLNEAGLVVQSANTDECSHAGWPSAFHLVVGNFFPWITVYAWATHQFNGSEEALLLHCHGFDDPYIHLAALLGRLGAEVTHLVFHGTNTPVPLLGTEFVRRYGDLLASQDRPVDTQVIFSDNLARPGLPVANSVGLCSEHISQHR